MVGMTKALVIGAIPEHRIHTPPRNGNTHHILHHKNRHKSPLAKDYVLLIHADLLQDSGLRTTTTLHGSTWNGEGGIRTHEGVTPTRFRVVRDQPDSATSPHALRRSISLEGDVPGTRSMLQKPTALRCRRLEAQPCSGNHLPEFGSLPMQLCT